MNSRKVGLSWHDRLWLLGLAGLCALWLCLLAAVLLRPATGSPPEQPAPVGTELPVYQLPSPTPTIWVIIDYLVPTATTRPPSR
jgi:hypothetical protein